MGEKDTRLVVDQIDLTGGMAIDARIRSVEAYGLMLALAFWVTGSLPTGITAKQRSNDGVQQRPEAVAEG